MRPFPHCSLLGITGGVLQSMYAENEGPHTVLGLLDFRAQVAVTVINAVGFFPYPSVGTEQALYLTSGRLERASQPTPCLLPSSGQMSKAWFFMQPVQRGHRGLDVWFVRWFISWGSLEDRGQHG